MVESAIPNPTDKARRDFLAAFGDTDNTKQEIIRYWQDKGKFTSPTELYAHLMEKRVESGETSGQRAGILRTVFDHSFVREHGTGYLAKHREPLVDGLAQLYAKEGPATSPIWRIEGDISNLGGLNEALVKSAKELQETDITAFNALLQQHSIVQTDKEAASKLGRAMADRVLHTICEITQDHLEQYAHVTAIRKGGDEISFIATLKKAGEPSKDGLKHQKDVTEEDMKAALEQTKADVAQFVVHAGLNLIPHRKAPGNESLAGVGVGLHYVDMRKHEPEAQKRILAQGIRKSKAEFQSVLHRNRDKNPKDVKGLGELFDETKDYLEITSPDIRALEKFLNEKEKKEKVASPDLHMLAESLTLFPPTSALHTVIPNVNKPGAAIPDQQRLLNLRSILQKAGAGALTPTEEMAIRRTHALTRKLDHVTGLPMFENMQEEQLPYFMKTFGEKGGGVKLINIDYNAVEAGNKLSEDVGDAMVRAYEQSLRVAMKHSGLSDYYEGLSIRPGAKFALLIPANVPKDTIKQFKDDLTKELKEISAKPLGLSDEVLDSVRKNINANEDLQKTYGKNGERLFDENGKIRIAEIINSKWLPGATVVMAPSAHAIDPKKSLGGQLKPLETKADEKHKQIYRERWLAGEAMPESFTARVASEDRSGGPRIKP